jgi:hypothetical protein
MRMALLLLCLSLSAWAGEDAVVYSLGSSRVVKGETLKGYGNAVAVDLSEYGLKGRRYLLTAAHLLSGYEQSWIKVDKEERACRAVWIDEGLDLAVVRVEDELAEVARLGSGGLKEGQALQWVSYHYDVKGSQKLSRDGKVSSRFKLSWLLALEGFGHGSSGSPVFKDGKLAGIALGVLQENGIEVADTGVVLPLRYVRMFLLHESKQKE